MAVENVEELIKLYFETDRSKVRKRYVELFGDLDAPAEEEALPAGEAEPEGELVTQTEEPQELAASRSTDTDAAFSELVPRLALSETVQRRLRDSWALLPQDFRLMALYHL